jgi:hypothetical protein
MALSNSPERINVFAFSCNVFTSSGCAKIVMAKKEASRTEKSFFIIQIRFNRDAVRKAFVAK